MKKRKFTFNRDAVSDSRQCLPDYSADWQLPELSASNTEIEARYYYEFARESRAILSLTEKLCHFTRRETMAAEMRGLNYPQEPLLHLHACSVLIANALMPRINLREISWNELEPDQQRSLINAFSHLQACRPLPGYMLFDFAREISDPTKPQSEHLGPRWHNSSRLFWNGIEDVAIRIDWSQGPQAVEAAIIQWLQRHKRKLLRLKSEGKLPGPKGALYFQLREETGAKNPRRRYLTALRRLGAMRLLGNYTLLGAIRIAEGSLFSSDVDSRSAWNVGIKGARQTFQELFYPQDKYSLRIRRCNGLPKLEEPISYQRYRLRREK
jgi:hypothetical protein